MKKVCICFLAVFLASCSVFQRKGASDDFVVVLQGQGLSRTQLNEVTRYAETADDSAAIADAYIRRWAGDVLFANKALHQRDADIESKVETYRRELYIKRYEEKLIKKMDHTISDDTVKVYYETHHELFVLENALVKGLLLSVPQGAPDMSKLRQWIQHPEKDIEKIEKYAYRYATGYQLFTDSWLSSARIVQKVPISEEKLLSEIAKHNQIEICDSTHTYLLQVTERKQPGDLMPLEVASAEIRKIMLAERQADFIREQKDAMYDEAEILLRIKHYE